MLLKKVAVATFFNNTQKEKEKFMDDKMDIQRKIQELNAERRRFINEYKMGLRPANEMVNLVNEVDYKIVMLENSDKMDY